MIDRGAMSAVVEEKGAAMIKRAAIGLIDSKGVGPSPLGIRVIVVDENDLRIEYGYSLSGENMRSLRAADLANGLRTLADRLDRHLPLGERSSTRAACRRYLGDGMMRSGVSLSNAEQDRILREAVEVLVERETKK